MRTLLLDVRHGLIDQRTGMLCPDAPQILDAVCLATNKSLGPSQALLVDGRDLPSPALARLQEAFIRGGLTGVSIVSAEVDQALDVAAAHTHASIQARSEATGTACGQLPDVGLHNAVFVSNDASRCQAAIRLGFVPYHFPEAAAFTPDRAAHHATDLSELLQFEPCHKKRGQAKGRALSSAIPSATKDARIEQLIGQVSQSRLEEIVDHLAALGTRWTYGANIAVASQAVLDEFVAAGYSNDVRFQPFDVAQAPPQRNVLCGRPESPSGYILLCAHYDSVSQLPQSSAPGCDDNASGVAVLIETARILRSAALARGVVYAAFGGEEQGLFGSRKCAAVAASSNWRIDLVINLDMVGFQADLSQSNIVVEYDQGNQVASNDAPAKTFGMRMAQIARDYTNLDVEHTDIWNSDYMPFEAAGFPCIGLYDGAADQTFYHSTADTADKLHPPSLADVTRLVVATVADISGFQ